MFWTDGRGADLARCKAAIDFTSENLGAESSVALTARVGLLVNLRVIKGAWLDISGNVLDISSQALLTSHGSNSPGRGSVG